jgi:hypothetical protein
MPTFIMHIILPDLFTRKGLHPSLQQGVVFTALVPVVGPVSLPTQQIVIESSSICSVSYGGSR